MRVFICAILCMYFLVDVTIAQTSAHASLDNSDMLIGDHRKLKLDINSDHAISDLNASFDQLVDNEYIEIIHEGNWETDDQNMNWSKEIIFSAYDSGYYSIKPIPVSYLFGADTLTVFSNDLLLRTNMVEINDSTQLAPIKDIVHESRNIFDLIPFIAGFTFIGLCFLLYSFYVKKKEQKEIPPAPIIVRPAHEIALEKLDKLGEQKLWQQGKIKEFQSSLTYILREYIEGRYKINALESTSDEILAAVRKSKIPDDHQSYLAELLQMADLVKFAKAIPRLDINERMHRKATDFVIQTKASWRSEEEE